MKVLLFNGSSHAKGCTYTALTEVAAALEKEGINTEIVQVGNQMIHPCMACGACAKGGRCVYKDDCVNEMLEKAETADGFIVGSPVHYASAGGAVTTFMDRFFYASHWEGAPSRSTMYKPGAAVVSCRRSGSTAALEQLNKYFQIREMPLVSSQYWNMVHGNTPEEVRQDLEGMQIMRTLGRNMAWLLKCIEAGRRAGVPMPTREDPVRMNFIH